MHSAHVHQTETGFDTATILRDIHSSIKQEPRTLGETRHLQGLALHWFAALNGWTTGPNVRSFRVQDIGKRSGDMPIEHGDILDHLIWFRGNGKCAAVVTQPYNGVPEIARKAHEFAQRCGVACHIPPIPRASFWNPGSTFCIVFTGLDHRMQWLPEQHEVWFGNEELCVND